MSRLLKISYTLSLLCAVLFTLQGCSEDAEAIGSTEPLTQAELQTILETDDIAGAADTVLTELITNAGAGKSTQKSNECYSVEYSDTGFVATFNNCVLNGTENVNGTLTVTYATEGETLSYTASYADFYVDTIKLNGTRTFVLSSDAEQGTIAFTVTSELSVEMEDESVITENGTKTFSFTFGENLTDSSFSLSGSWTIIADGNTYQVETTTPLVGGLDCEYMTSGSMTVSKNGLEVTVDFGDGECDDVATLTYPDGTEEEISL